MKKTKLLLLVLSVFLLLSAMAGCGCKHEYTSEVTTPSTCTEEGVMTYTCQLCGKSYIEAIEKDDQHKTGNHDYSSEITKEATPLETGTITYTCSRCGDSYTESIPKIESNWEIAHYVDDFGDETESGYIRGSFWGNFSNSATTASDLWVVVFYEGDSVGFRLIEYGSHVATWTSGHELTLKTKDQKGTTKSYDLFFLSGDSTLYSFDSNLVKAIKENEQMSMLIEDMTPYGSKGATYSFKIDNVGLSALLTSIS